MKNHLISYPRSGNHWVRFIVEWFSGKPTKGMNKEDKPIYVNLVNKDTLSHVSGTDYILFKNHWYSKIKPNENLILIVRNPKEAIIRHKNKFTDDDLKWFMGLIKSFHNHKGNKILIYYEDLLTHPKSNIENILKFLNILDEKKLNIFMDNYEELFNESINVYDNTGKKEIISGGKGRVSKTKGKKLNFHSNSLTNEDNQRFINYLNNSGVKKYIIRYE